MKLSLLNEEFIEKARRPMSFGALPVEPREADVPVIAVEKWREVGGKLVKRFKFHRDGDRLKFVIALMSYEENVQHHGHILVNHDEVTVGVATKDVDRITELDKEYAAYCDVLFKDVVYSPLYDGDEDEPLIPLDER